MKAILFEKAGKDNIYLEIAEGVSNIHPDDTLMLIRKHIGKYKKNECKTHRSLYKLCGYLFGPDELKCRRGLTQLFMTYKFKLVEILENNYTYHNSINISIRGEMHSIPIMCKVSIDDLKEELYPHINESEDILWGIIEKYMHLDNYSALNVDAIIKALYDNDYKIEFLEEDDKSDIHNTESLDEDIKAYLPIYSGAADGLVSAIRMYYSYMNTKSSDYKATLMLSHVDDFAKTIVDTYNKIHKKEENK